MRLLRLSGWTVVVEPPESADDGIADLIAFCACLIAGAVTGALLGLLLRLW